MATRATGAFPQQQAGQLHQRKKSTETAERCSVSQIGPATLGHPPLRSPIDLEKTRSVQSLNTLSSDLVGFVSRILVERVFFQNQHIPQDLLLHLSNDLLKILHQEPIETFSLAKELPILWKQARGEPLTREEELYDQKPKELDVLGEILHGVSYSSMTFLGQCLYTSLRASFQQGLYSHILPILGYSSTLLLGSRGISYAVKKVLSNSQFSEEQQTLLTPWLHMVGRLALGFIPKVHANEQGVHYHYPSTEGFSETFTRGQRATLQGDQLSIEREGELDTPEGPYKGTYVGQFRLTQIKELHEERVSIVVTNHEGKTVPVIFRKGEGVLGAEIEVICDDQKLKANWERYFKPQVKEEGPLQLESVPFQAFDQLACYTGLSLGTIGSMVTHSLVPVGLGLTACIKPAHAESLSTRLKEVQNLIDKNYLAEALRECERLIQQKKVIQQAESGELLYQKGTILKKFGDFTGAYGAFSEAEAVGSHRAKGEKKKLDPFVTIISLKRARSERVEALDPFRTDFLKGVGMIFPLHYEYMAMSALAYCDKDQKTRSLSPDISSSPHLERLKKRGWEIGPSSFEMGIQENGYFGIAFFNKGTKQLVIANRGTEPLKPDDRTTDWSIVVGKTVNQLRQARDFDAKIREKFSDYTVSHTGHSLGGVLATFLAYEKGEVAVTADTPPVQDFLENDQSGRTMKELFVTNYLSSQPNLINTYGAHLGDIRSVSLYEEIQEPSFSENVWGAWDAIMRTFIRETEYQMVGSKNTVNDAATFSRKLSRSHDIHRILSTFDPVQGYSKHSRFVEKWPKSVKEFMTFEHECIDNGFDPGNPGSTDDIEAVYKTHPSTNRSKINLEKFTDSAQKFLRSFYKDGEYFDNFNLSILLLFKLENDEISLRSNPELFTADDFKSYIEHKLVETNNRAHHNSSEKIIHRFDPSCTLMDEVKLNEPSKSFREYEIFFGLKAIKELSKESIDTLEQMIRKEAITEFKNYLYSLNNEIVSQINAELKESKILPTGISQEECEKFRCAFLDYESLVDEIFEKKQSLDMTFLGNINSAPQFFIGKMLDLFGPSRSLVKSGQIVAFEKKSDGFHFTLEDSSKVFVEVGADCEVRGINVENYLKGPFLSYFKLYFKEEGDLIELRLPSDGVSLPDWVEPGSYRLIKIEEAGEDVRKFRIESEKNNYEIILNEKKFDATLKNLKNGESITHYQLGRLEFTHITVTSFDIEHEKSNEHIHFSRYLHNKKFQILEKIESLEQQAVVQLIEDGRYHQLSRLLDALVAQNMEGPLDISLLEELQMGDLLPILTELQNYNKELDPEIEIGSLLSKVVLEANYQRFTKRDDSFSIAHAMTLLSGLFQELKNIEQKDLIVFLGETGSGKGTSISYLLGADIYPVINNVGRKVYRVKQDDATKRMGRFPEIGESLSSSQTFYVKGYKAEGDIYYVDTPGLGDTRGSIYQLCASLGIDEAIRRARSIQSVVVTIPHASFFDRRGNGVIKIIDTVQRLIPGVLENIREVNLQIFITKEGDVTNKQLEVLLRTFEQESPAEEATERKKIWAALVKMFEEKQVTLSKIGSPNNKFPFLKGVGVTEKPKKKNFYPHQFSTLMAADDMYLFRTRIEEAAATWNKQIITNYLVDLPNRIKECESTITQAKDIIEKERKSIEINNASISSYRNFKESLNNFSKDKGTILSTSLLDDLKESRKDLWDLYSKNLGMDISAAEANIVTYEKEVTILNVTETSIESEIDKIKQKIIDNQNKIAALEVGSEEVLFGSYRPQKGQMGSTCNLNKGAVMTAKTEIRGTRDSDCVEGKYTPKPYDEYDGPYHISFEIEKEYQIVPTDPVMREAFEKHNFATNSDLSKRYRSILRHSGFELNFDKAIHPSGMKMVYYFISHWKKGGDLPWMELSHELPRVHIYSATISNLYTENADYPAKLITLNGLKDETTANKGVSQKKLDNEIKLLKELQAEGTKQNQNLNQLKLFYDGLIKAKEDQNVVSQTTIDTNKGIIADKEVEKPLLEKKKRNLAVLILDKWNTLDALSFFCDLVVTKGENDPGEATIGKDSGLLKTCSDYKETYSKNKDTLKSECQQNLKTA